MKREFSRRWQERKKLTRRLCGMLDRITVERPAADEWGGRVFDSSREVCRGWGYRYYKFERTSLSLETPGRLSREKSERVLFLPDHGIEGCCASRLPQAGDFFDLNERRYSIWSVQESGNLYLTLVVEQIQ